MYDPQTPVATIVLEHSECAAVFARHHVDYCCMGERSLAQICEDHGLQLPALLDELELAIKRRSPDAVEPTTLTTHQLITQVIGRHHRYLHRTLPSLRELANKVARVHGPRHPALLEVARLVDIIAVTFTAHLTEEEEVLFPAMLADRTGDLAAQLADMRRDHEGIGALLVELRTAAEDFAVPDWGCTSYRALAKELAELEADTLQHVHVENYVLLPRFTPSA